MKPLTLISAVLLIVAVAGVGGYWLGIRASQNTSQNIQRVSFQPNPSSHQRKVTQPSFTIAQPFPTVSDQTERLPPTAHWKTYSNEMLGFELKYPPYYHIVTNDPYGKRTPKFVDERYNRGYEAPGLTLDFDPIPDIEMPYFSVQSSSFDTKNRKGNAVRIYFTNARGQKIYATCTLYDPDTNVLNICNAIVSTIKFAL